MHKTKRTSVLPILIILVAVPLAAASPSNYPLHEAIRNSDLDRLTGLLQAGHDPDEVDELGRTALHYALAKLHGRGYLYVSELLRLGQTPTSETPSVPPLYSTQQQTGFQRSQPCYWRTGQTPTSKSMEAYHLSIPHTSPATWTLQDC